MMKRVLVYGDSNTWGLIPGKGQRYSDDIRWPKVLGKLLGDEYEVIENGIVGRTTCFDVGWGDCKNGRDGFGYAVMSSYPIECIVFMLGGNDVILKDAPHAKYGMDDLVRIAKNADSIYINSGRKPADL